VAGLEGIEVTAANSGLRAEPAVFEKGGRKGERDGKVEERRGGGGAFFERKNPNSVGGVGGGGRQIRGHKGGTRGWHGVWKETGPKKWVSEGRRKQGRNAEKFHPPYGIGKTGKKSLNREPNDCTPLPVGQDASAGIP